jgi:hypothetical protein
MLEGVRVASRGELRGYTAERVLERVSETIAPRSIIELK